LRISDANIQSRPPALNAAPGQNQRALGSSSNPIVAWAQRFAMDASDFTQGSRSGCGNTPGGGGWIGVGRTGTGRGGAGASARADTAQTAVAEHAIQTMRNLS
jgi:hypothetical protein